MEIGHAENTVHYEVIMTYERLFLLPAGLYNREILAAKTEKAKCLSSIMSQPISHTVQLMHHCFVFFCYCVYKFLKSYFMSPVVPVCFA